MNKAILCVAVLALMCTAAYAQNNTFDKITHAAKSVTDTVDKGINGTRNAVNTVTNGTKSAVDGVKKAAEAVTGKTSVAGFANPAVGVFAAAGFGSLLLLAL